MRKVKKYHKTCAFCSKEFESTAHNKLYCSKKCQRKMEWQRYKKTHSQSHKARKLTEDTAYLVCLWRFRDRNTISQISQILDRPEWQIKKIISDCKSDGRWDEFKRFWHSLNIKMKY